MTTALYLDTARLGRMTPRAQEALCEFGRLCGEQGASAGFEDLLIRGSDAWRTRYPGLGDWSGVTGLRRSLRTLSNFPPGTGVLLAHRSAQLMRLAARVLFHRCARVLHTDLEWPGYLATLRAEGKRLHRDLVCAPVRAPVFRDAVPAEDLVARLAAQYRRRHCDGLFLSAVSSEGVRLPVAGLLEALEHTRPRLVVIDGAQALGHAAPDLGPAACDFYLAGCHKWLEAGQPLGLGFCPRRRSRGLIATVAQEMIDAGELDDPLLLFTRQLEQMTPGAFSETVSLANLFSSAAAVATALDAGATTEFRFATRLDNAEAITRIALDTGWTPIAPSSRLRSGIVLLRSDDPRVRAAGPEHVRSAFLDQGVALTTYPDGLIRLSMPPEPWNSSDLDRIQTALRGSPPRLSSPPPSGGLPRGRGFASGLQPFP
jgi:selenocysteine lyase/cysteine desulfurase